MTTRSGTSNSAGERAARGRPNKLFPLTDEIDAAITKLDDAAKAEHGKTSSSRAMVVSLAVAQLAERFAHDPKAVIREIAEYTAEDRRRAAERRKADE